jgi:NAD(P)-dependent dehydrogenase (short-subunit alcohol dehydrogenase family)
MQRTGKIDFAARARNFDTNDVRLIIARLTQGLLRAQALEARLEGIAPSLDAKPRVVPYQRQPRAAPTPRQIEATASCPRRGGLPLRSAASRSAPLLPLSAATSAFCHAIRCGVSCARRCAVSGRARQLALESEGAAMATKKIAIVTGAASGIGRAITLGLVGAGIDVAAVDRNEAGLAALAAAGHDKTGTIQTIPADLAQPEAFDAIVSAVLSRSGRIDVLVNNAGIGQASIKPDQRRNPIRMWEITHEQWQRFLAVNATGPIMMARAVVPHMLAAGAGRVITVTTSLGTMVRGGYLLYGASKAAAEAAMAVLAADLKGTGVTSNVLVPGGVTNTAIVGDEAGHRARMLQPEIMVPPLLWLISDAASEVSARRFVAMDWDASLPPAQAAEQAGVPIAWLGIARMPVEPA